MLFGVICTVCPSDKDILFQYVFQFKCSAKGSAISSLTRRVFVQRSSVGPEGADDKFTAIAAYANGRIHLKIIISVSRY